MCVRGLTNHSASRLPKIYSGVSWQIVLLSPFDKCFCVIHWNSLLIGFCQLDIIDIPAVAEGIEIAQCVDHGAGGGQGITPCVIGVRHHLRAAAGHKPGHVALRILQVEVLRAIELHYKFTTFCPTLQPYIHFPATFSHFSALFAYAQKSGMQRQPVCAIHRRAANCSSMCRHWSGFDRRNCNWWYRREWHRLTMPFPCDWITALFFFGKTALFYISEPNKSTGAKDILERLFQRFPQEG